MFWIRSASVVLYIVSPSIYADLEFVQQTIVGSKELM